MTKKTKGAVENQPIYQHTKGVVKDNAVSTDRYLYSQASWQSRFVSEGNTIPSLLHRYQALFRPELHTLHLTDLFP